MSEKHKPREDSASYRGKKQFYKQLLTVYGRKPALEAMSHPDVEVFRLHLANSNQSSSIVNEIVSCAEKHGAEICYHDRKALSRISKNGKQDQGVAVDLKLKGFTEYQEFLSKPINPTLKIIALDGVNNPQNLGMIIRSCCAAPNTLLLLPRAGCAKLDALVVKASAGTLFRAQILRCDNLHDCLKEMREAGFLIAGLSGEATNKLNDFRTDSSTKTNHPQPVIYILGNETSGLSADIGAFCDTLLCIPLANQVESLNVAVCASLIAFYGHI